MPLKRRGDSLATLARFCAAGGLTNVGFGREGAFVFDNRMAGSGCGADT